LKEDVFYSLNLNKISKQGCGLAKKRHGNAVVVNYY